MARPPDGLAAAPAPSSELWTLQEGVQGVSPGHSFVPLTRRPASFSVRNSSEGNGTGHNNKGNQWNASLTTKHSKHQQPFFATTRAKAGSGDNSASFNYSWNGAVEVGAKVASGDATWTELGVSAAGAALSDEGFPLLRRRRRTFTEPTRSKSRCSVFVDDGTASGGLGGCLDRTTGSGGVPMSISEDNMLGLLRKRSNMSTAVPLQPEQQARQPSCRAAVEKARQNTCVMRRHRAELVEDMAKCVMDVAEGTTAAATATGEAHVGPLRTVTLEGVMEHLQSLPERYALSADPEDVLTHMALFDEVIVATDRPSAASTTSPAATVSSPPVVGVQRRPPCNTPPTVRVLVCPSRSSTAAVVDAESCRSRPAAEVTPPGDVGSDGGNSSSDCFGTGGDDGGGGGGGGGGDSEGGKKTYRRCSVTVVCSQSLLPLGAVSSALLSAGAICRDADVMSAKTATGARRLQLSLARFEVDVAVGEDGAKSAGQPNATVAATAAAAAAAAAAEPAASTAATSASAGRAAGPQSQKRQSQEGDEPLRVLAGLLSSTIAANILEGQRQEQRREEREGTGTRCGTALKGDAGDRTSDSNGERCPRAQPWMPSAQATVVATAAAMAPARGEEKDEGASLLTVEAGAVEVPRHPSQGKTKRRPLARRQGEFFLAEANANTLRTKDNTDGSPFGGGGDSCTSGGSNSSGRVSIGGNAKPIGRSDDISRDGAPDGIAGSGNPSHSDGSRKANDGRLAFGSINNDAGNNSDKFPAIPPEDVELLELAGTGRFSRTYMARWRGVTVAVKTLVSPPFGAASGRDAGVRSGGDGRSAAVAEFERELHIVRELRHPNVRGFRGACMESPDRISLVYDFLANGTLGDRLRDSGSDGAAAGGHGGVGDVIAGGGGEDGESRSRRRPKESLSTANLVAVVKDVVDGMIYLHELGVLHRDLKPENILLDANDRAVVADFGLATFCNPANEHTAETGTYRWMAPEVIRHEPYSRPADVYSFGMVLWQVLTRRQPFEGLTPVQAAFSVASQGRRPQLPPTSPPALSSLIRRCWHQIPDSRPSFSQVRAELAEIERQMLSR